MLAMVSQECRSLWLIYYVYSDAMSRECITTLWYTITIKSMNLFYNFSVMYILWLYFGTAFYYCIRLVLFRLISHLDHY